VAETIKPLTGRDVRLLRMVRGLSMDFVAEKSGISHGNLSLIENGKRRLSIDHEVALVRVLFPADGTQEGA